MLRCALSVIVLSGLASAAAPRGCVGSVAVTSFRLSVQGSGAAASRIPIRHVNNLPSGYRISYQPLDLPSNLGKDGKLALVMVPKSADGSLTVLEPRAAAGSTEWSAPFAPRIMLLVFAPQGLDEKRLTNLVTKDENLVAALADYADQTADVEAGLQLATELEQEEDDAARPQRPSSPAEQAIFALVRALNPAVSSYDPFGTGRRVGAATLTGKGISTFFENAGGIFPGAGALPMVKQWLLPDTEFRSVYGIDAGSDGVTLCTQLSPKSRNKLAYIWAYRLTNSAGPMAAIEKNVDVPIGLRMDVPVKLDSAADWRLLDRVFDWALVAENGPTPLLHVSVRAVPEQRALRVDLRNFPGPAGAYRIEGKWDWSAFKVNGSVRVHAFDNLKAAALTPESQDKLIAGTGPVTVELAGADFLFVDHASLHRPSSFHQIPLDLPPDRAGAQDRLRLEVDTDGLRPGPYLLALSRIDGATTDVPLRLLPPNPKLDRAPLRVNAGEREQTVIFTGSGLDRIEAIQCDCADIVLAAPSGDGSRRGATVRLRPSAKSGDVLTLLAKVEGIAALLQFPGALQVAAARPQILEAKASLPADLPIAPRSGEIPAGVWVSYALKLASADAQPTLTLQCAEPSQTVQVEKLHVGEKHPGSQLLSAGDGALFLSLDPGAVGQSGCTLTAALESESLGKSDAIPLGKIVQLPRIESLSLTDEKSADGFYGVLKGFDLATIGKTGWDARTGIAVAELPRPVAGEGAKQTLRVVMPWPSPSPKAPLYVWLRGEPEGRATKVTQ
jgi:hypothetical protein